jgi:multidrug efflux system membrane fusion protein
MRTSITNEPSTTKRRAGEILSIGIVVYTLIVDMICLHSVNANPRTDDAEVFANFIGIAPQVDGPIVKLYVEDNQFVHKGDLLMEIDDQPYRYALQHANSEREALEGQIEDERRTIAAQTTSFAAAQTATRTADANVSRYAASVDEAKASVLNARVGLTRAQEDLNYASSNLGRIQPLLAEQFVTADQVDQAKTLEATRRQALEQARSHLKVSEAGLESALAQYEQSKAALDQSHQQVQVSKHSVTTLDPLVAQRSGRTSTMEVAEYNLSNYRIYAPFDARVTNLTISEGAYAHTGQQILTLIDTRAWWVMANFRETQLSRSWSRCGPHGHCGNHHYAYDHDLPCARRCARSAVRVSHLQGESSLYLSVGDCHRGQLCGCRDVCARRGRRFRRPAIGAHPVVLTQWIENLSHVRPQF